MAYGLTGPQIKVGGTWLTSLTTWSGLKITDRWPGGCWEAAWTVPTEGLRRWQQLKARANVEVYLGGSVIWAGFLSEPNWDSGEMVAVGSVRHGEEALAVVNATGLPSSTPDTAIDDAKTRGAHDWVRRASLSAVPFVTGDETDAINYLTALLDTWSLAAGVGWGVNAKREVFTAALPTTPTLRVTPNSGVLGVADDAMASRIWVRYVNLAGATSHLAVGSGVPELVVDLRDRGLMDSTRATTIASTIYAKLGARTGWTNGLQLTTGQLSNMGGAQVNLANVSAGARGPIMLRLDGLRDERGVAAYTDIVLSETVWDVDGGTVDVAPVGLVARDLASIIEAVAGPVVEVAA